MRLHSVLICALVLGSALLAIPASAQSGYPEPDNVYINDFARALSPQAETYLRQQLEVVEQRNGIQISIVTINTIADYDTPARTFEAFATGLFNTWGIGDAAQDNGILLLAAIEDRDVRVELGAGYSTAQNADAADILDENLLPAFRRGDYQVGIVNAARAIINEFTGVLPPLPPASIMQAQPAQTFTQTTSTNDDENENGGGAFLVLLLVILGGGGLIWFFNSIAMGNGDEGWAGDSSDDSRWDDNDTYDGGSNATRRSSWSSSSSRRSSSSSSSSSSRRSSFGGGKSRGGGSSRKW
jgi:uncharacterized protein